MTEQFTHALCALIRRLGQEAKQLRDNGLTIEQKGRRGFLFHRRMCMWKPSCAHG